MNRNRLQILLLVVAVAMAALLFRLAQLQLADYDRYRADAYGKRVHMEVSGGPRGTIYDRFGRVLAEDVPAYDMGIVPLRACARNTDVEARTVNLLMRCGAGTRDDIMRAIYGDGGVKERLAASVERQARWLMRRGMLKISDADARALVDTVRNCTSLAAARTTIRERFGAKCLEAFDGEAAAAYVLLPRVPINVRDAVAINAPDDSGVKVLSSSWRRYAYGESACHIIGYVSQLSREAYEAKEANGDFSKGLVDVIGQPRYDALERSNYFASQIFGRSGIESAMDDEMRSSTGAAVMVRTPDGDETLNKRDPDPGKDVRLTIDINLQAAAEQALGARKGAVVVMDVETGEILAMATWPRYDLNTVRANYAALNADTENTPLVNRAVMGMYSPGSSIKVIEAVAAVHEIPGYESVHHACNGTINVGGMVGHCRNHMAGDMDLHMALKKSCNIFFYKTASALGPDKLAEWFAKFGIAAKTGVEIGEAAGRFDKPTSDGATWNTAIGQGTLIVTPLQMARVTAAIANGGKLVTPHFIMEPAAEYKTVDLGLKPDRLKLVKDALWAVVNEQGGTANKYIDPALKAAGKTGTAETAEAKENNTWFIGYAPYDKPKVCIAVVLERVGGHGGDTSGPVADAVLKAYFGLTTKE